VQVHKGVRKSSEVYIPDRKRFNLFRRLKGKVKCLQACCIGAHDIQLTVVLASANWMVCTKSEVAEFLGLAYLRLLSNCLTIIISPLFYIVCLCVSRL
jgi:hypothetical protein